MQHKKITLSRKSLGGKVKIIDHFSSSRVWGRALVLEVIWPLDSFNGFILEHLKTMLSSHCSLSENKVHKIKKNKRIKRSLIQIRHFYNLEFFFTAGIYHWLCLSEDMGSVPELRLIVSVGDGNGSLGVCLSLDIGGQGHIRQPALLPEKQVTSEGQISG